MKNYQKMIQDILLDVQRAKWFKYSLALIVTATLLIILGVNSSENYIFIGALVLFIGFIVFFIALIHFSKQSKRLRTEIALGVWIPMLNSLGADSDQQYQSREDLLYETDPFVSVFRLEERDKKCDYIIQSEDIQISYQKHIHRSGQSSITLDFEGLLFIKEISSSNLTLKTKYPRLVKLSRLDNEEDLTETHEDALYKGNLTDEMSHFYDTIKALNVEYVFIHSDHKYLYVAVEDRLLSSVSAKSDQETIKRYKEAATIIHTVVENMNKL